MKKLEGLVYVNNNNFQVSNLIIGSKKKGVDINLNLTLYDFEGNSLNDYEEYYRSSLSIPFLVKNNEYVLGDYEGHRSYFLNDGAPLINIKGDYTESTESTIYEKKFNELGDYVDINTMYFYIMITFESTKGKDYYQKNEEAEELKKNDFVSFVFDCESKIELANYDNVYNDFKHRMYQEDIKKKNFLELVINQLKLNSLGNELVGGDFNGFLVFKVSNVKKLRSIKINKKVKNDEDYHY